MHADTQSGVDTNGWKLEHLQLCFDREQVCEDPNCNAAPIAPGHTVYRVRGGASEPLSCRGADGRSSNCHVAPTYDREPC